MPIVLIFLATMQITPANICIGFSDSFCSRTAPTREAAISDASDGSIIYGPKSADGSICCIEVIDRNREQEKELKRELDRLQKQYHENPALHPKLLPVYWPM